MDLDSREDDAQTPRPRRIGPRTWAAIGCTVLTLLALALLGSIGLLLSRLAG